MLESFETYIILYAPLITGILTIIVAFIKTIATIKSTLKNNVDEIIEIKKLVKDVLMENKELMRQNRELKEKITHIKEPLE